MTKDEALRLALEALKEDRAWLETDAPTEVWEKNNEAITAIKTALEAKVEPVACVIDGDLYFHHEIDWEDLAYQGHGIELLYTTTPHRTWIGLTENEAFACQGRDYFETYRSIEAKLKEKNP